MKLIIARHGETEENVKKIIQGQKYGKLTNKGIEQAKKLAQRLKNEKIDVIFSSDLQRAKDTTKEIAKFHKVPIYYVPELRERAQGIFEGEAYEELYKARKESGISRVEFRPEGGENYIDIKKRAEKFLNEVFDKYKGKTVLLISHGGLIAILLAILLKKPIETFSPAQYHNAGVNIIEVGEGSEHKVHVINCIKHL